ncbi:MAG: Rrf2 family transcriptional regulator [Methanobrevibacter thaueri]|jgi:DNA-binding MarR family transcriptional regulator|uniref:winged helix-turn-helix domain-containing protein n=1 Tax=Methanobrevibacter thaueri TaxID=190975 RepID=UPI0026EC4B8A|nr:winged helix-turn-helix domain-containing protein [Methanobrevibacter thaueri]MBE6496611.1 Rrf2 family transcriptional regulator [Methanobrevibacter thaueri]
MSDKSEYVKKSSYRVKVLKSIGDDVKIPTEIAKDSGILKNHISNVLRDLKEQELVECLNPKSRKGRLYRLTEEGSDILDEIK